MLNQSIKILKGIGGKKAEFFANLGVHTLRDLLHLYPLRYEDLRKSMPISELRNDQSAVFLAMVEGFEQTISSGGKKMTRAKLAYDGSSVQALFVHMPYLQNLLKKGEIYWFYGKVSVNGTFRRLFHPEFYAYPEYPNGLGIKPIYPLSRDLKQKDVRNAVESCKNLFSMITDPIPDEILSRFSLISKAEALYSVHFPKDLEEIERARFRLKFEELYLQQKKVFEARLEHQLEIRKHFYKPLSEEELFSLFEFELTASQKSTLQEIQRDLDGELLMRRLVFGDVGSGKTAIAIASCYLAVKSGFQACVMAPTEVLAKQHFLEFSERLGETYRIALLVSSEKNKKKLAEDLREGRIDIVVGTHALIEEKIDFKNLALVVTDEQHRFGVRQRKHLKEKAKNGADVLSMSATPIPRTLSMVYYGDIDISYLTDMPKGRKKVITRFVDGNDQKRKLLKFIYDKVKSGEQAYFLAPRIDDDEEKTKSSVEKMYHYFKSIYKDFSISALHGKMKAEEKNAVMQNFKDGKVQILISTTVIEVGVNVPNATIMLISNMEHFGLSQLHQLRGRVGRSEKQSYCFLTTSKPSDSVALRVQAMETCDNGFDIAEMDLKLRGPGEISGSKQHGFERFRLVDYSRDQDLIQSIRNIFSAKK